jgi:hypothetical protein
MGGTRNEYNNSAGKQEGKRPLGRAKRIWKYYKRVDPKEIGCERVDWSHVHQNRTEVGSCEQVIGFHKIRGML